MTKHTVAPAAHAAHAAHAIRTDADAHRDMVLASLTCLFEVFVTTTVESIVVHLTVVLFVFSQDVAKTVVTALSRDAERDLALVVVDVERDQRRWALRHRH